MNGERTAQQQQKPFFFFKRFAKQVADGWVDKIILGREGKDFKGIRTNIDLSDRSECW